MDGERGDESTTEVSDALSCLGKSSNVHWSGREPPSSIVAMSWHLFFPGRANELANYPIQIQPSNDDPFCF